MRETGRFAPSPSGQLHLGNLFCFLLAWLSARAQGGEMVLRIEDLDPDRTRTAYARGAEDDLRFLGLDWDRGGVDGGTEYSQGRRTAYYQTLLERLDQMGLTYPCFCSRAQLHAASAPHASDGEPIYPGTCRDLAPDQVRALSRTRSPAVRLRVDDDPIAFTDGVYGPFRQRLTQVCGDFLLRRSDGVFAYQLAVVADDAAMGVTQVVRGRDLLSSTPRQLYLYRLLGFAPPRFYHTPLLLAPDGRRLSKRDGDVCLDALRARGLTGPDVVGRLAFLAGLQETPRPVTPRELLPAFSWDRVPRQDICLPPEWL